MKAFLYDHLRRLTDSQAYFIAYSGGMDSHVLLHALVQMREQHPDIALRAMHVHHGFSDHADQWATHCKNVCRALNVPFLMESIVVNDAGASREAAARDARYSVLAKHLHKNECLLTAHSQDDQAETLLLQLLRGAGPKGLSAMPPKKPIAHTLHLRPLLKVTRDQIKAYAQEQTLQWIEDDSNADVRFDRNYLRHHVMPLFKKRWPSAVNNIARSAVHCAHTASLLSDLAQTDMMHLQGTQPDTLSVTGLLQLSALRRANVLRDWVMQHDCRAPSTQQLAQLEQDVLRCDWDATPVFSLDKKILRRYRDDLFLVAEKSQDPNIEFIWDRQSVFTLPNGLGELKPEDYAHFTKDLIVRFRRGGESIKLPGSAYTQSLKKLFQQWGVPPWERDTIPLLFEGDSLVSIVGYDCVSRYI